MADLLEQGMSFLDRKRYEHMTRTVTYQRGNSSVELQATLGQTNFEQSDEYGIVQKVESHDFLIRTGDLVLDGETVLPKAGDLIRDTAGANVFVCEVSAPGNEPPFRYSDPYRKALRIHTKHVATEIA
ncbi:MAG: hypothetical protein IT430_19155 [Phycisphaerales bacterium]|nr:hypothetical protein [Phycisphaerales bacterium]